MSQSNHRKKGGGINEREPSAFIAYTYDSKTMPPCKMQSAKQKVLDEITGFARSRHPVKVYCYQWTTSNFIKERASGHLAIFNKSYISNLRKPIRDALQVCYIITSIRMYPAQSWPQTSLWPSRKKPQRHNC